MLRNVAWVGFSSYIEAASGLIVGVLIARTLGPTNYGHYAFSIWLCSVLIMASNNGLAMSSIKFLAEARGAGRSEIVSALVSRFARLQLLSSSLVMCVFIVVMVLRPIDDWRAALPLMVSLAVVGAWSRAGFWMWGSISSGHEMFRPKNLTMALMAMINVLAVALLAWQGASLLQFFMLYAFLGLVSNVVLRWMLWRSGIRSVRGAIPPDLAQRVRRHVLLTGMMVLLFVGTNRGVEMTLLKIYASAESLAYFAIAGALTKGAVDLLAGGMSAVLLPAMARQFGAGGSRALAISLIESTRLYWMIGLIIAGLGLTVSEGLVHLLYGQRYEGAIPILTWTLVVAGLAVVSGAAAAVLTASDRLIDRLRVILGALAINLVLGLWLIPKFGLTGALVSLVLTQVADALLLWFFAFRCVRVQLPIRPMVLQTVAATVATALACLTSEVLQLKLGFVAAAAVFVLVYLPLCVVLRTLRATEFEVISHIVARLGPHANGASRWIASLSRFTLID